jgi:hypothetical protein
MPVDLASVARKAWKNAPLGESVFCGLSIEKDEKILLIRTEGTWCPGVGKVEIIAFPRPKDMEKFDRAYPNGLMAGFGGHKRRGIGSLGFKLHGPQTRVYDPARQTRLVIDDFPRPKVEGLREYYLNFDEDQMGARSRDKLTPGRPLPVARNFLSRIKAFAGRMKGRVKTQEQERIDGTTHNYYGGWLNRAMLNAFRLAEKKEYDIVFNKDSFLGRIRRHPLRQPHLEEPRNLEVENRLEVAIRLALKKHGAEVIADNDRYLILRPKARPTQCN